MLSYSKAVKSYYGNAFKFSGRATRGEYWWGFAHYMLVVVLCCVVAFLLGDVFKLIGLETLRSDLVGNEAYRASWFIVISANIFTCLGSTYVPYLSLTIRRLHDTGFSGWVLLALVCFGYFSKITGCIAICILLVLMLLPGNKKDNKYGSNPYVEDMKENETDEK